jgi:CHAT domain-containing protein/tetratricopeptide (TPR) repeat protein
MRRRASVLAIVLLAFAACDRHDSATGTDGSGLNWSAILGPTRPGAGRLSSPVPHRSKGETAPQPNLQRDAIRARLEQQVEGRREPEPLHALAVLELLSGRSESAAALLEETLEQQPESARAWNDLGVVHLTRWEGRRDDGRTLIRALDAFLRAASLDRQRPEPRFNLAVAYAYLGLHARARSVLSELGAIQDQEAWRAEAAGLLQAIAADPAAEWKGLHERLHQSTSDAGTLAAASSMHSQAVRECVEDHLRGDWGDNVLRGDAPAARARLAEVRTLANELSAKTGDRTLVDAVRELDDSGRVRLLARGYAQFARGREAYEAGAYERARAALVDAERAFSAAQSVFVARNRIELATSIYQFRDVPRAREMIEAVLRSADAAHRSVVARAEWLHGLTSMQSGALENALRAFEQAYAHYAAIGELENAAAVTNTACDSLRIVGERGRGWVLLAGRVLPALPSTRSVRRRYVALLNASLYASADGFDATALAFQDASLDAARERGVVNTLVEALSRRAALLVKRRDWAAAASDLNEARRQLAAIPSTASATYQRAWLDSVEAEWLTATAPDRAQPVLDAAVREMSRVEPSEVPRLLLIGARAAANRGDGAEAERVLRHGMGVFEERWAALTRDTTRTAYVDEGRDLYRVLAQRYASIGERADRAFLILERGKGMALMKMRRRAAAPPDPTIADLRRSVPPGAAALYLAVVEDQLLSWTVTSDAVRFRSRDFDRARITRRIASYRLLLEARRPSDETARLSAALFDEILGPSLDGLPAGIDTLAVVPDDVLYWVPFATLTNAATGRQVVDDFALIVASSAKELIDGTARLHRAAPQQIRVLSVGNGFGSPDGRLPPLREAEAEAVEVASHYARGTVLVGPQATGERVRRLAASADVLHFAGHAVANDVAPERSFLLMAPSASGGTVTGDAIAGWPLGKLQLAVLSACRTASGAVSRGEGVLGLVRPFLAAGVPAVVGASWDVDDHATRVAITEFHACYAATRDAPASLRRAQLKLKASPDPRLRDPGAWGAFIVMSGFPPRPSGVTAHGIS